MLDINLLDEDMNRTLICTQYNKRTVYGVINVNAVGIMQP